MRRRRSGREIRGRDRTRRPPPHRPAPPRCVPHARGERKPPSYAHTRNRRGCPRPRWPACPPPRSDCPPWRPPRQAGQDQPLPAGPAAFTAAPYTTSPSPAVRSRVSQFAQKALADHAAAAHTAAGDVFTVRNMVVDHDGSADVRFDRTYKGLPAYGGDVILHLAKDGTYRSLATASATTGAVSTKPRLAASRATAVSRSAFRGHIDAVSAPRLAVQMNGSAATLVWETVVSGTRADRTPRPAARPGRRPLRQGRTDRDEVDTFAAPGEVHPSAAAPGTARTAAGPDVAGNGNSIYSGQVCSTSRCPAARYQMKDPSHGNGCTTNMNHSTSGTGTTFTRRPAPAAPGPTTTAPPPASTPTTAPPRPSTTTRTCTAATASSATARACRPGCTTATQLRQRLLGRLPDDVRRRLGQRPPAGRDRRRRARDEPRRHRARSPAA